VLPRVGGKAGLIPAEMGEKLVAAPTGLLRDLWQEDAAAAAGAHHNAVLRDVDLTEALVWVAPVLHARRVPELITGVKKERSKPSQSGPSGPRHLQTERSAGLERTAFREERPRA
jgi:hypothetical protein